MGVVVNPRVSGGELEVEGHPKVKKLHGVWYYPGWKDNPNHPFGPPWTVSWFWKDSYPARQPTIGWYDEGQQSVMDGFIDLARDNGVDYFAFNWYYNHATKAPVGDHAINNFFASTRQGVYGAVALETQTAEIPITKRSDWVDICTKWKTYFPSNKYLKINGRPVVFVVKLQHFHEVMCPAAGMSHKAMLDLAREITGENIYFVACGESLSHWVNQANLAGYDCFSAYNLFSKWADRDAGTTAWTATSFAELYNAYEIEWKWNIRFLPLDYCVPFTSGFDARPWGAQNGVGMAELGEWKSHVQAAFAACHSSDKVKLSICYAWNEHGEGGWLLPDVTYGTKRLDIYKSIMKSV
jgi:hypothetical protein